MAHLKQTDIDINTYENNRIKRVSDTSSLECEEDNDAQDNHDETINFPKDKVLLFIVVTVLLLTVILMVNGIVHRG